MDETIVLCLLSLLLSLVPPTSGQIPCPDPEDISPCTCSYDEENGQVSADCSLANVSEIYSAFNDVVWEFNTWGNVAITELSGGIFGNVSFQHVFIMYSENLVTIDPSFLLAMKDTLVTVSFTSGRLEDFPWDVVPQLVVIEQISLDGNAVTTVPELQSSTLQSLWLRDNRITTLQEKWILPIFSSLALGGNPFSEFSSGFFADFGQFGSFYCQECNFGPTLNSGKLEFNTRQLWELHLEGNHITTIEAGAISGYTAETKLNLDENSITEVKEEVFRPILEVLSSGDGIVSLLDNPIQCVCSMAWLVLNQTLLEHVVGNCENGPSFQELDPFHFEESCMKMNPPMPGGHSTWVSSHLGVIPFPRRGRPAVDRE
ncbi:unnamed protein product [Darwinula stevensoni]|uniref:Oplophorus-luciferin 2-monooxygenase non-catalytic subunit n=1 Tax=Darwinula stevensoni TaxID=69355 RepID=A0A7R9A2F2_9CRUS|nr:unnamed protein product [Darwinula stevensoni]CAG0889568.1 unnamed protein product [Darwinula stevensoni]